MTIDWIGPSQFNEGQKEVVLEYYKKDAKEALKLSTQRTSELLKVYKDSMKEE